MAADRQTGLLFFAEHPAQVFSRAQLLTHVWDSAVESGERTVDVHVTRLAVAES